VLRYLKGTPHLGLVYKPVPDPKNHAVLECFADCGYQSDHTKSRSVDGVVFLYAGSVVTMASKLQKTPSSSTAAAEYQTLARATNLAMFYRQLLTDMGFADKVRKSPTTIYEDNTAAISLATNMEHSGISRFIRAKYHVTRYYVEQGDIRVTFIPTSDQVADIMTKPLPTPQFKVLVSRMGMA